MNGKHFLVGTLIVAFSLIVFILGIRDEKVATPQLQEAPEKEVKQMERPIGNNKVRITEETITPKESRSFKEALPPDTKVKDEAGENPHRTPESLITFAEKMGPLVEKAMTNKEDAKKLIVDLRDCALDSKVAHSARALCLSNADKLAAAHPELKGKAKQIRSEAPEDIVQLVEKKNMLFKK